MKIFRIIPVFFVVSGMISCGGGAKPENENTLTSGKTKIAVDETMSTVIQNEIDVFQSLYPATISPIVTTETNAIDLLLKDSVRMAVTARKLTKAELDYFHSRKFEPEVIRIAIDGVAIIVNKQNKDTVINVQNLKRIMTGEVTRWDQIYPKSKLGKLQMVFDNKNSSIVRYAIDSICRDKKLSQNLNALELNREVVDYVSKTPNAMGVIGVNLISNEQDTATVEFLDKIQVMRVGTDVAVDRTNSVQPYQYYLYIQAYPLRREIYIILNDPRGELPKGFTSFVAGDKGQRIIKRSGLLPAVMPISTVHINEE